MGTIHMHRQGQAKVLFMSSERRGTDEKKATVLPEDPEVSEASPPPYVPPWPTAPRLPETPPPVSPPAEAPTTTNTLSQGLAAHLWSQAALQMPARESWKTMV